MVRCDELHGAFIYVLVLWFCGTGCPSVVVCAVYHDDSDCPDGRRHGHLNVHAGQRTRVQNELGKWGGFSGHVRIVFHFVCALLPGDVFAAKEGGLANPPDGLCIAPTR